MTESAIAHPASGQADWAPGVIPMTVYTAVMATALSLPSALAPLFRDVDSDGPRFIALMTALGASVVVLVILAAVAGHRAYAQAKTELGLRPDLRGAWLVKNLWWVAMLVVFVLPGVLAGFVEPWAPSTGP